MADKSPTDKWGKDFAAYQALVVAGSQKFSPKLQKAAELAAPVIAGVAVFVGVVGPLYVKACVEMYKIYTTLPQNVLGMVYGFLLCFMGSFFPTLIAAVETFKLSGWDSTYPHIVELWEQHKKLAAANDHDNKKDDDGDGVADVDQVSKEQLVQRKTLLFLRVADPEKVNRALGGVWMAAMGVIAALKVRFAKTIMLAVGISNTVKKPLLKYIEPQLKQVIPPEYHKWVRMSIDYACKLVAVTFAWWLQRIVSAVHSAVRGGHMCATYTLKYLAQRDIIHIDPAKSNLDELVGWILTAVGLFFQMRMGFGLPFPFNIIFFPLTTVNWMIEWAITD